MNAAGDSEEVKEGLKKLNKEYEETFPGLRYVVWVNGRPRTEIMADMRRRIDRGDLRAEEREGIKVSLRIFCSAWLPSTRFRLLVGSKLGWKCSSVSCCCWLLDGKADFFYLPIKQAMCDIAADRAAKLLKSAQQAVEHTSSA